MISGYMMKTWQREGGKRGKKKKNPYILLTAAAASVMSQEPI